MAARRLKRNPDEEAVREAGRRVAAAQFALAQLPCPKCGARTLDSEVRPRSGVWIFCEGYLEGAEDDDCDFTMIVRVQHDEPATDPISAQPMLTVVDGRKPRGSTDEPTAQE